MYRYHNSNMTGIESFDGKKKDIGCLGCAYESNKTDFSRHIIIETEHFTVGQDFDVPILGFFIISTRKHILSIADFSKEERKEFIELVCRTRKGMRDILGIREVCLFQNEGSAHHFHLWMLPRYDWMAQFGRGTKSLKPILEHAKQKMKTKDNLEKIDEAVKKMRKYIKKK
jgi:diadenosine tetraphosphate (Ap4A) HIT family hydrolase